MLFRSDLWRDSKMMVVATSICCSLKSAHALATMVLVYAKVWPATQLSGTVE